MSQQRKARNRKKDLLPSEIEVHSFAKKPYNFDTLDCEKEKFKDYLIKEAEMDHNSGIGRVFLFVYKTQILGFVTVAMSQVPRDKHVKLESLTTHATIPGLLLGQLARHSFINKVGFGQMMLAWVINHAIKLSKKAGCRVIIVQSDDDKVGWYIKNGFALIKGSKNKLFYDILEN